MVTISMDSQKANGHMNIKHDDGISTEIPALKGCGKGKRKGRVMMIIYIIIGDESVCPSVTLHLTCSNRLQRVRKPLLRMRVDEVSYIHVETGWMEISERERERGGGEERERVRVGERI